MAISRPNARTLLSVIALILIAPGCVVEPVEGFHDRDHHRWWHEHHWRDCGDRDEHCRDDDSRR